MTKSEYRNNLSAADELHRLSKANDWHFWQGYKRGLSRCHYGEIFGTDEEHAHWMTLLTSKDGDKPRYIGLGYQCGFKGTNASEALKELEQADARLMALEAYCPGYRQNALKRRVFSG